MAENERREDGEGFLSAWSRRKRAVAREKITAEVPDQAEVSENASQTDGVPEQPGAEEVDEAYLASLPPLEDITGETDLQPFLKKGVPQPLRNAAMRKVWLANTLIRNHDDPAVDYAWDWNAPEGVPGAGGAISEDSVSKMVKTLVNREKPAQDGDAEPSDIALDESGGSEDAVAAAVLDGAETPVQTTLDPPSPVRRAEKTGRNAPEVRASAEARTTVSAQPDEDAPAARRHGGARPS